MPLAGEDQKAGVRHIATPRGESVRKRTKQAIVMEILKATLSANKKMRIMYKSNLNYERFNRYFTDLKRKGFIESVNGHDGRSAYRISERGRTLLATLEKAEELFSSEKD